MAGAGRWVAGIAGAMLTLAVIAPARAGDYDDGLKSFRGKDYSGAMAAWQKGATAGDARAEYSLGYLYEFGLGVPADNGQAKTWYDKAAAAKNGDALYALGRMYESGDAGSRSLTQAMADYKAAADAGSGDGAYAVGRMLLRGMGANADPAQAVTWLQKAAGKGIPAAYYMLGAAFEAGWPGHGPGLVDAYYWYSRAAGADQQALHEADPAFNPKVALAQLRRRMTKEQLAAAQARLKSVPRKPAAPAKS